jgi:DNA-binding NtrC family response regulator
VIEMMITHHIPVLDAMQRDITSDDVERLDDDAFFIGASIVMRKLRAQAQLLAATDAPVLILGESGSGKRTTAQLIHQLSIRSGFEFAGINCAALPCDLLESELFGNEQNGRGSASQRLGKLKLCEKGTILLDEITEMPMSLQAKLVQVLQNKRFVDSGGATPVQLDVRILAASTASVERAVANKKLREDLYYNLSAYTIQVPPLRERREEIPLLLHYFMRHLSRHYAVAARTFSPAVLDACQSHSWPGNLRELETFVKRFLLAGETELKVGNQTESGEVPRDGALQLATEMETQTSGSHSSAAHCDSESLKARVRTVRLETERNAIAEALKATGWNRKAAARLLKVSYRTLLYKVDQYRLKSPDSSSSTTRLWRRGERDRFGSAD